VLNTRTSGTVAGGEQSVTLTHNSFFLYRAACGVHGKVRAVSSPFRGKRSIVWRLSGESGGQDRSAIRSSAQVSHDAG